ncbi:hypothetical protein [Peribacillus cavernae]|nr:hypothetical protein [Peribacillus cavernae]MDQ0217300.1 hypothetical protein [Peribacillus cavernae]
MKNNKKQLQEEKPNSNVREEFGNEFTGDMNAAKIYDVLLSDKKDKKRK